MFLLPQFNRLNTSIIKSKRDLFDSAYYFSLFLIVFLIYGHTIGYKEFIFDDAYHISKAKEILEYGVLNYFIEGKTKIPIFYSVIAPIVKFFPDATISTIRVVSIILHILNSIIIYHLIQNFVKRPLKNEDLFIPALLGTIYCVHPLQVESIVWISSIKGNIATLLTLISTHFYIKKIKTASRLYNLLAFVFYVLGILSKPVYLLLPLFLIFAEHYLTNKSFKDIFKSLIPYIIISIPLLSSFIWIENTAFLSLMKWRLKDPFISKSYSIYYKLFALISSVALIVSIIMKAKDDFRYRYVIPFIFTFFAYLYFDFLIEFIHSFYRSIYVFLFALVKSIVPIRLSVDYGITNSTGIFDISIIKKSFILFTISCSFIYFRKKKIILWITTLYLMCLPFLGFIYFEFSNISYFADRFSQFLIIGLAIAIIQISLYTSYREKLMIISTLFGTVILFTYLSHSQSLKWKTTESILLNSLRNNSTSIPIRLALIEEYKKTKGPTFISNFYEETIMSNLHFFETQVGYINYLIANQKYDQVIELFESLSLVSKSINPKLLPLLAIAYNGIENKEKAIFYAKAAIKKGIKSNEMAFLIEQISLRK